MAQWDELVAVALLGTEQQKSPAMGGAGELGALLQKLEAAAGKSREAIVLCAAGTIGLHAKARQVPETTKLEAFEEAPETDAPLCSQFGPANLALLMDQYSQTLLPIWLSGVASAGRRVPELAVPALLNYAVSHVEMRETVAKAIGHRGRWLAKQNPEWSFAAGEVNTEDVKALADAFEIGNTPERIAALKALRQIDPDKAREVVAGTWKEDSYDLRARFLEMLKTKLSMADELFLEETALEDKRKEVRTLAANLLATLTESRYHKRMVARAVPLLTMVRELLNKRLDVSLPTEADAAAIRDGLTKAPAQLTAAHREQWLIDILSAISPKLWETHLKATPQELIDKYATPAVRTGWVNAATLHGDPDWIEAICCSPNVSTNLADIFGSLGPSDRERVILKMIEQNKGAIYVQGNDYNQPIMAAMMMANHNWSAEFGRSLIRPLYTQSRNGVTYYGTQLFNTIGFYFPASLLRAMEETFDVLQPENVELINKFLGALKFKAELFGDIK